MKKKTGSFFNFQGPKIHLKLGFFPCHQTQAPKVWTLVYRDHVHRTSRKSRSIISTQKAPFMAECCRVANGLLHCSREGLGYNYIVPVGWTPMFIQCGWVLACPSTSCFPTLNCSSKNSSHTTWDDNRSLNMTYSFTRTYNQTNSLYKIFTLLPWHPGWNGCQGSSGALGQRYCNSNWSFNGCFYIYLLTEALKNSVRALLAYLFTFWQTGINKSEAGLAINSSCL